MDLGNNLLKVTETQNCSICCIGNFRWVNSMEWSGQKMFVEALDKPFLVENKEMGLLKSFGPLSFLKVSV